MYVRWCDAEHRVRCGKGATWARTNVRQRTRRIGRAIIAIVGALLLTGCWPTFQGNPARTGNNPFETAIGVDNVADLQLAWSATTGGPVGSPVVAGGVVFVGSSDNKLRAFDADGGTGCSGSPPTCQPLWTFTAGDLVLSTPTVADGIVYVGSHDQRIYAFDAAGNTGCSGTPKTCEPLWQATTESFVASGPVVVNGVLYVSGDHKLYAFDAAGATGCSGTPKTCQPLWTAHTGAAVRSSPAVANGTVYVGSTDHNLYAYDAAGITGCAGTPRTCQPLWTAETVGDFAGNFEVSTPAVDGSVVYVAGFPGPIHAFDAAGSTGCTGVPKFCQPLWRSNPPDSQTFGPAGPSIANGFVYAPSQQLQGVAVFDAAGSTGCSGTPKLCNQLWTYVTNGDVNGSAAVANGVLYVGSFDNTFSAFDAAGNTGCSGSPKICQPLWTFTTGNDIFSSPAVAGGFVYVGSNDGKLYAFHL